jgi:acyl carrier protein
LGHRSLPRRRHERFRGTCIFFDASDELKIAKEKAMNIEQTVIDIVAREQHLDRSTVRLDSTFAELGIDSLDGINILFALEAEMNISIPDTVARSMKSVQQVVDSLTRVIEGKDISDLVALAHEATPSATVTA